MPDPTPERIAAALALAEAVDAAARACDAPEGTPPDLFQRTWLARCEALTAYRATLPKLRSRAEDAEMGQQLFFLMPFGVQQQALADLAKYARITPPLMESLARTWHMHNGRSVLGQLGLDRWFN